MQRSIPHAFGVLVLVVVMAVSTACTAKSGAAGVRAKLNGYPDLGWSDAKMNRVGAKVCAQFPNGVFGDPRVAGTASDPAYASYVGDPGPNGSLSLPRGSGKTSSTPTVRRPSRSRYIREPCASRHASLDRLDIPSTLLAGGGWNDSRDELRHSDR